MKLTEKAKTAISNRSGRDAIMQAMGFTESWTYKVIKANKVNGPLTTAAALKVIERETGLSQDEILETPELVAQDKD